VILTHSLIYGKISLGYGYFYGGGNDMEMVKWRELLEPYRLAIDEIMVKFEYLKREYREKNIYCPIETVNGRVKKISSILEKMNKKNIGYDDIEECIEDIAGIRIICQFAEDIDVVANLIHDRSDMEIKEEKDYVNNPKDSGYRSYHMIVYYTVMTLSGEKKLKVELQIRTLAMNFWATIEHSLQYKYSGNMPVDLRSKLKDASAAVLALDSEMSSIRNEILDAQNLFIKKAEVVADILNNIENLYNIASEREVEKIQSEFYKVYKRDSIDDLRRFRVHLDNIAEGYKAQSLSL